ncbi:hypothetical protein Pfo_026702 [Paulownia fortunei]|nr:hypothetical protein Pfo_026702 [Paulownia fortunei]
MLWKDKDTTFHDSNQGKLPFFLLFSFPSCRRMVISLFPTLIHLYKKKRTLMLHMLHSYSRVKKYVFSFLVLTFRNDNGNFTLNSHILNWYILYDFGKTPHIIFSHNHLLQIIILDSRCIA